MANDENFYGSWEDAERHNEEIERREAQDARGEDKSYRTHKQEKEKPRKAINYTMVEEDVWNILVGRANQFGQPLASYCAEILTAHAESPKAIEESNSFKLNVLRRQARNYFESLATLEMVAAEYNSNPSADLAEILIALCDQLGKDPEDIKSKVKNDPMAEEIANFRTDPDTKTARCRKWMIDLMRKNEYRIPATVAIKEGFDLGFTKDMIAQVRRKLRIDSLDEEGKRMWIVTKANSVARSILGGEDDDWGQ